MVVNIDEDDNHIDYVKLCSPFIMGEDDVPSWLLQRYLPEVKSGLLANWIGNSIPAESCVLDPFGGSPTLITELARQGYRVVTCVLNPVVKLLLEVGCHAYSKSEYQLVVEELARSIKEDVRFDQYIQSFYQTRCNACGATIQADEYLWEKGAKYPDQVVYECSACGISQQHEPTDFDRDILDQFLGSPLYRALAVDRIAGSDPDLKQDAKELTDAHPARALYVIVALFTRLDALQIGREKQSILQSLLLAVMDCANTLWPVDQPNHRPKLLLTPTQFREFNLWKTLRSVAGTGSQLDTRIRTVLYPEIPASGEICIFPGRVRDLLSAQDTLQFDAVVTAVPRPNQAFWKLSAAWSAWLLGREVSDKFSRIIIRDRYDWSWHANALLGAFQALRESPKVKQQLFALVSEVEPAFLSSVIPAAHRAGWKLCSFAISPEDHLAEIQWHDSYYEPIRSGLSAQNSAKGAESYLKYKGEPADYLEMTCASLLQLEYNHQVIDDQNSNSVQTLLKTAFSDPAVFMHIGPGEQTMESGHWWLKGDPSNGKMFSDLVEREVLEFLSPGNWVSLREMEKRIRNLHPIYFGEIRCYIQHIVASYAEKSPVDARLFRLKEKEDVRVRQQKVNQLLDRISKLGESLNCHVEGSHPVVWQNENYQPIYRFYVYYHTAILGDMLAGGKSDSQGILVIPASRLDLLNYKIREFPAMEILLSGNWHVVKFRLMSRVLENPLITLESFDAMIKTDPVESNPDQFLLF
jgi:hypothetical protein